MLGLLSLPLTALNGTVIAASVWEYLNTSTWQPATDCAPACGAGTTCCQDPASPPPGTCYAVTNCAQLPGPGASIEGAWAPW